MYVCAIVLLLGSIVLASVSVLRTVSITNIWGYTEINLPSVAFVPENAPSRVFYVAHSYGLTSTNSQDVGDVEYKILY